MTSTQRRDLRRKLVAAQTGGGAMLDAFFRAS